MNDLSKLSADQKRDLLKRLLREKAARQTQDLPTEFPLSAGQQGLWYAHQRDPSNTAYNVFLPSRIRSEINLDRLRHALELLVTRHRSLRTVFAEDENDHRPIQRVSESLPPEFRVVDATGWTTERLKAAVLAETQRPFDLGSGPLLRLAAFKQATDDVVIIATAHHIVVDFWSLVLVLDEVNAIYSSLVSGKPPGLDEPSNHYHEFVEFQSQWIASDQGKRCASRWRRALDGIRPKMEWVTDFERPRKFTHRAAVRSFALPKQTCGKLIDFAKRHGVTENAVVMSVVQALLARFSGQDSFSVGTPFSGRSQWRFEKTVGFFVNLLPITADLSGDPTLAELTERVAGKMLDALSAERLPLAEIVRQQSPARDTGHHPLFQVSCTFEKSHLGCERGRASFLLGGDDVSRDFAGLRQQSFFVQHPTCLYDLEFVFEFHEDTLRGMICYCRDLFAAETIEMLAEQFVSLADSLLDQPETPVKRIDWKLSDDAAEAASPDDAANGREVQTVPGLLSSSRHPIVARARRFASLLTRQGVRRGAIVPVCLTRGPQAWVAILAVMHCGATPVPIDADQPAVLPEVLRNDAEVTHAVGDAGDPWLQRLNVPVVEVGSLDETIPESEAAFAVNGEASAENLAYVIYTSGSTGKPKGVMVAHRAIACTLNWRAKRVRLDDDDRVLVLVSHGFDAAMAVVLSTLQQGATPVWPNDPRSLDLDRLIDQIIDERITVLPAVPSLLSALAAHPRFAQCRTIRQVWSGGEPITHALIESITSQLDCSIWNFYGPTEAAVEVAAVQVAGTGVPQADPRRRVPIGPPLDDATLHVLNEHLRPVPAGVAGQIAISGRRLAVGYLNRPEQTASAFVDLNLTSVQDAPRQRVYLTGDRGRFRDDGQLEWLGRLDHQVKLNGYRIELEEIEAVLQSLPGVRQAAVKIIQTHRGDQRLAGYVVCSDASDVAAVRRQLRDRLPSYKRPATITALDALPVGASGKVLRDRLPDPDQPSERSKSDGPPRTALETFLAERFCTALEVGEISLEENFFEAGGTSLQAAILTAELSTELGVAVPTALLFDLGSVSALQSRLAELHPSIIQQRFGIASLESALQSAVQQPADPLLAEFSPTSGQSPVFMIHPPGGIVVCYRELARQLHPARPLVAIRSRGLHGDEPMPESMAAMAAEYARVIDARQPLGPIVLGGWSLGGVIAFEVAAQLIDRGRSVGGLVLIDSTVPENSDPENSDPENSGPAAVSAGAEYGLPLTLQQLGELNGEEQLPFLYEHAARLGVLDEQAPPQVVEKTIADLQRLFAHHVRLCQAHRLKPIDVATLLLRPREVPGTPDRRPDRGWRRWTGSIQVHSIAGHHHSMVQMPGAAELADRIDQFVAEVSEKGVRAKKGSGVNSQNGPPGALHY